MAKELSGTVDSRVDGGAAILISAGGWLSGDVGRDG